MEGETRVGAVVQTEGNGTMSDSTLPWEDCTMTVDYMGPTEVAAYLRRKFGEDRSPQTIRNLAALGKMPAPDGRVGTAGGWLEATIDEWWANRPGQGARTDLAASKGK